MAFYKYGLAFLAGTGFGAAMTTLRNSRCPFHKHESCSCHCRRHGLVGGRAGESPAEAGREREEYYDDAQEKEKRCPKNKKAGKEKKGDRSEESSD